MRTLWICICMICSKSYFVLSDCIIIHLSKLINDLPVFFQFIPNFILSGKTGDSYTRTCAKQSVSQERISVPHKFVPAWNFCLIIRNIIIVSSNNCQFLMLLYKVTVNRQQHSWIHDKRQNICIHTKITFTIRAFSSLRLNCFSLLRISSSVWMEWTRFAILSSS